MAYLGNLPLSDGAAALELLFAQKSDIDHRLSISDVDGLADALAGGGGVSDSGGTGGGASGCYSEAFMRDAYGNNGGGFGNGMDTSVTTSGVTSVAHNFSGGGGNNSSTGGGKGGIGGGGGGGAVGGNGLVIVEW